MKLLCPLSDCLHKNWQYPFCATGVAIHYFDKGYNFVISVYSHVAASKGTNTVSGKYRVEGRQHEVMAVLYVTFSWQTKQMKALFFFSKLGPIVAIPRRSSYMGEINTAILYQLCFCFVVTRWCRIREKKRTKIKILIEMQLGRAVTGIGDRVIFR
jgi:hypothetical protein